MLASVGTDVDDPVGVPDDVEIVFDHEQGVARGFELVERAQQRFGVRRMQAGGGFVEHVDDAEQVGADLGRETKPLQLTRRQRWRAAIDREVAEAEIQQHREPCLEVLGDSPGHDLLLGVLFGAPPPALGGAGGKRAEDRGQALQRQARDVRDVHAREGHRQRLAAQPLALAHRTVGADQIPGDAPSSSTGSGWSRRCGARSAWRR